VWHISLEKHFPTQPHTRGKGNHRATMPVPVKAHVLKKLEASHRETVLAFAYVHALALGELRRRMEVTVVALLGSALQQRAQVAVERAAAAEERLTWATNEAVTNGQENKENVVDAERLQQLMHENERLHAQLASARLQ
jgi:hypothetical protein